MDTKQSIDQRERIRRSFDKIRVNNPFDDARATIWDGFPHVVPAHGHAILERYLAEKWLSEQAKRIMTEEADKAVKAENERRVKTGALPMDKTYRTREQETFERPFFINWQERWVEVIKKYGLYGGVVQEYGMDYMPGSEAKKNRDLSLSLIEELESTPDVAPINLSPIPEKPVERSLVDDLEGKSQFELRAIAKERGIATEKTDKKADLIRALTQ